ncbi:MAG TPA: autotransporter [Solirubrobacteraceae bacterium]|jgi:hypothetical protein|nr:autotransporter [Solirubrobacteraceae bacterium]
MNCQLPYRAIVALSVALAVAPATAAAQGAHAGAGVSTRAETAAPRNLARVARVLTATDTANLHYVSASGSLLFDEGKVSGTLPGNMRVHLNLGTTFSSTFTIFASGGSISGRGSAKPHGSGNYESFAGTLIVTGGTGRYAHARGRGHFYGTFNRSNYALVVKTTGSLTY